MNYLFLLLFASSAWAQTHCVVNEIMYAPLGGEPEWVEVYNPTSQSVNVKNWKIRDLTATKKTITTKDAIIAPKGFMVLAKDTAIYNFHFMISEPVVALSLPSLNNDSDAVILYDAGGAVVDSLVFHNTWGGTGGASLERVRYASGSTTGTNWKSSRDDEKSTPGRRNSVAPQLLDAALDSVLSQLTGVNRFTVTAVLHNEGELTLDSLVVRFAVDYNNDSVIQADELYHEESAGFLAPGKTRRIGAETPRLVSSHRALVELRAPGDGDLSNNRGGFALLVTHTPQSIVLNEIMYAPAAPEPEWCELQNRSADTIDCTGWKLATGSTSYPIVAATLLAPGDYLVVAKDTGTLRELHPSVSSRIVYAALPTLNNTGSALVLRDEQGIVIDSISYRSGWGGAAGTSLERIDSSASSNDSTNWNSSLDTSRSTCGVRNSRARAALDVGIAAARFSDDSSEIIVTVKNFGLLPASSIFIGAQIDSMPAGTGAMTNFFMSIPGGNAIDSHIQVIGVPRGDNMITVSALVDGDQRMENNSIRVRHHNSIPSGALAVNEIMYAPRSGQAEYIELVNLDTLPIDLLGCRLNGKVSPSTHHADTLTFATAPIILAPGEYAVIASDTTIYNGFSSLDPNARALIQRKSSLNLTNDSDDVVIADAQSSMIDSVHYTSAWHSPNVLTTTGVALERVNPRLQANDHTSWASSVAAAGGTPAAPNSVFTLLNVETGHLAALPVATLGAAPNPFSPDGDGFEDLTIFHYEIPFSVATYSLRIFNTAGREMRVVVNSGRASHDGVVVWDGRDADGVPLPMGMYIAVLDAADPESGNVARSRAAVIVAHKL